MFETVEELADYFIKEASNIETNYKVMVEKDTYECIFSMLVFNVNDKIIDYFYMRKRINGMELCVRKQNKELTEDFSTYRKELIEVITTELSDKKLKVQDYISCEVAQLSL